MAKSDALTDLAIRHAKPKEKPYKLTDGRGLHLLIAESGSKRWRLKYHFRGTEKLLSLGAYPDVSLAMARQRRDDARRLLAQDIDPSEHRKATKALACDVDSRSFEAIAREWHTRKSARFTPDHAAGVLRRLERDVFPRIGARPIDEITGPELLAAIRPIEHRGAIEQAHRALWTCRQILAYAMATGLVERNIALDIKGALTPMPATQHRAAITDPAEVAILLRQIDGYAGTPVVRAALQLAPLVFVRPGELRTARWADIDLGQSLWRYRVTKTGVDHVVPLARQAVAILREIEPITCMSAFVFPSARSRERPMSENAVLAALRGMGIPRDKMTGHGFRALARTILDEQLRFPPHLIEHQLAHAVRDPLGRAYNRTAHLDDRRAMMQAWADYLDSLRNPGNVVAIGSRKIA